MQRKTLVETRLTSSDMDSRFCAKCRKKLGSSHRTNLCSTCSKK